MLKLMFQKQNPGSQRQDLREKIDWQPQAGSEHYRFPGHPGDSGSGLGPEPPVKCFQPQDFSFPTELCSLEPWEGQRGQDSCRSEGAERVGLKAPDLFRWGTLILMYSTLHSPRCRTSAVDCKNTLCFSEPQRKVLQLNEDKL